VYACTIRSIARWQTGQNSSFGLEIMMQYHAGR
jgi:hypothetical protein